MRERKMMTNVKRSQKNKKKLTIILSTLLCFYVTLKIICIFLPSKIISLSNSSCSSSVTPSCSSIFSFLPEYNRRSVYKILLHFIGRKLTNVKRSQKNTKKLTMILILKGKVKIADLEDGTKEEHEEFDDDNTKKYMITHTLVFRKYL